MTAISPGVLATPGEDILLCTPAGYGNLPYGFPGVAGTTG